MGWCVRPLIGVCFTWPCINHHVYRGMGEKGFWRLLVGGKAWTIADYLYGLLVK